MHIEYLGDKKWELLLKSKSNKEFKFKATGKKLKKNSKKYDCEIDIFYYCFVFFHNCLIISNSSNILFAPVSFGHCT